MIQRTGPALVAAVGALAGCGGEEPKNEGATRAERSTPTSHSVEDPRGDVQVEAQDPPRPRPERLDLRRVTLRRERGDLVVSFLTAAPPGRGVLLTFNAFGRKRLVEASVEVRFEGGRPLAVARAPGGTFEPVPVKVRDREVVVRMPLNRHTREGSFKWRASSADMGPPPEIRDRLPSTPGDVERFPGR